MKITRNPYPIDKWELDLKRNPKGMVHYKMPSHNWGGMLPNPPADCEKKKFIFEYDEIDWLDLSICHGCHLILKCKNRNEYLKALQDRRDYHFKGE